MRFRALAGLICVVAAALFLRCGDLSLRPLHNDEAINAFKLQKLWSTGEYRYDPHEYHGPVLYYASLPVLAVASLFREQPDETGMRSVAVAAGIALLLGGVLLRDGMGWGRLLWAGLLIAASPVMVFFSRYYIHELLLVLFTLLSGAALWRYSRRPSLGWAAGIGAGVGLMYATKETFVFAVLAGVVAWGIAVATTPHRDGEVPATYWGRVWAALRGVPRSHWLAGVVVGAATAALFFSSLGRHGRGLADAVGTYLIWLERAGGSSPHVHPWWFYLERLAWFRMRGVPVWTEALVLVLAVVGGASVFLARGREGAAGLPGRFLAVYTVVLGVVYSILPYKTPWCVLGFYHGALLLAGFGAWQLVAWPRAVWAKAAISLGLLAGVGHLGVQAHRATREYAADFRNPWVYGHTSADLTNLLELVDKVVRVHPEGRGMPIQVMAPESQYWPLPWYWRGHSQVGWWDGIPENPYAPVVVTANRLGARLDERSEGAWRMVGMFELRPRFFMEVYVEAGLWKRFLESPR